jgi:rubrerythrin
MIEEIKDIVESEKTIRLGTYEGRQMETFERLGTKPNEWKVVPLVDVQTKDKKDVLVFDIPKGYDIVQPFYDSFGKSDLLTGVSNCQLCGHPIKNEWYIQHDGKKIYLALGSECINNFKGAKYTEITVKVFKDNRIRQIFTIWKPEAVETLDKFVEHDSSGKIKVWYSTGENRLQYWAWKLREKIKKMNPETTSSRKLNNMMKKFDKETTKNREQKMIIRVNGKTVEKSTLGDVLHNLTHKTMFYSGGHLQKTWAICNQCGKQFEMNTPESALDFVSIHEKSCGKFIQIDIDVAREVVIA